MKILGKFKARDNFDPASASSVDFEELEKILKGDVKNPNKPYGFRYFVVCDIGMPKLHEEENLKFNSFEDAVEDVFYKSQWFGKFTCDGESNIVIPNKYTVCFDPKGKPFKIFAEEYEKNVYWGFGGFFQRDKDAFTKIIPSSVSLDEMKDSLIDHYSKYDNLKTLEKIKREKEMKRAVVNTLEIADVYCMETFLNQRVVDHYKRFGIERLVKRTRRNPVVCYESLEDRGRYCNEITNGAHRTRALFELGIKEVRATYNGIVEDQKPQGKLIGIPILPETDYIKKCKRVGKDLFDKW